MRLGQVLVFVLTVLVSYAVDSEVAKASFPRGDVNCSGLTNGRDALDILLTLSGEQLTTSDGCSPIGQQSVYGLGGDVNCDDGFDLLDLITTLKIAGGLPVSPCLAVTSSGFGSVSQELGPGGGTLTTTGLDGTEFSLEVQEGALLGPELISMTPVDTIADLPVPGGLVAAVNLQPSGLVFWDAAILTVSPAIEIAPADQTAFVIRDGEFVPHPPVLNSAEIQLPLTQFSVAGIAEGPVNNLAPASTALAAYTAELAALTLPQRVALIGGGSGQPGFASELAALMEAYYEAEIAPGLDMAGASRPASELGNLACSVSAEITARAFGFSRQGERVGADSFPGLPAALMRLGPSLAGCRESDFQRCVQFHDLSAISRIVAYTRIMAVLMIDDDPGIMEDMIERCARFEIRFISRFCVDDVTELCDTGIDYAFAVQPGVGFFSMPLLPSQGPLVSVPLTRFRGEWGPAHGCEGTMTSPGSVLKVLSGGVSMNPFVAKGSLPVTLVINPGIPEETLELACNFGNDTQISTLWWQKWCDWHQAELAPPYANTGALCFSNEQPGGWGFAIRGWTWNGFGHSIVFKDYIRKITLNDPGFQEIGWETSTISLYHAPLP